MRRFWKVEPSTAYQTLTQTLLQTPLSSGDRRSEVLRWLVDEASSDDALWVLSSVYKEKPDYLTKAMIASDLLSIPDNTDSEVDLHMPLLLKANSILSARSSGFGAQGTPVIQFVSPEFWFSEGQDPGKHGNKAQLQVIRLGPIGNELSVSYETHGRTAHDGQHFRNTAGVLVFSPNVTMQTIEVEIINDENWGTIKQFDVELKHADGAFLELNKSKAIVNIVDDDCFPTNKYAAQIGCAMESQTTDRLPDLPFAGIMWEYFKMNFQNPVVRRRLILIVILDQIHNLTTLVSLFAQVYLVDHVLQVKDEPEHKPVELFLVALAMFLPLPLKHGFNYIGRVYGVGGESRKTLQSALFRTYLYYQDATRENLAQGTLIMGMFRDVPALVEDGFGNLRLLADAIGELIALFVFIISCPMLFGDQNIEGESWFFALFPVLGFPITMLCCLLLRSERNTRFLDKKNHAQDALLSCVEQAVQNFDIYRNFKQRSRIVFKLENLIAAFNKANREHGQVMLNSAMVSSWLAAVYLLIFTPLRGFSVMQGTLTLGMFLTNLSVIHDLGRNLGELYGIMLSMQAAFPALGTIVALLNLPITGEETKAMVDKNRDQTLEEASASYSTDNRYQMHVDLLSIKLTDVSCNPLPGIRLEYSGEFNIEQGQMVALVGPPGAGKHSFLKLLGGVYVPDFSELSGSAATFMIPSHLRRLYLSTQALFIQGTLNENLTFGADEDSLDANPARVLRICKLLGIRADILDMYLTGVHKAAVKNWSTLLSESQAQLVQLARAFIFNPDLLFMNRPCMKFDEARSERLMSILRDFVSSRGLQPPPGKPLTSRRPRTCVWVASTLIGLKYADRIFHVGDGRVITEITHGDVERDMVKTASNERKSWRIGSDLGGSAA